MYNYIQLDLNQLLDIGVHQWLQIYMMDICLLVYGMVKGLICQLVHSFISLNATMAWYPAETSMCALVIQ